MRSRESLRSALEAAKRSEAYASYLEVRERVLDWLDETPNSAGRESAYWQEELEGFEYMLDASPLVIAKLREHCYHLTGLRSYDYRSHHRHKAQPFAEKLESLRAIDRSGLFVAEPPILGGFGHQLSGGLVNLDTLKLYEALIALDHGGILGGLREAGGRSKVVVEIGSGWGGFAQQLKTVCPEVSYVVVDLPQAILFSATYLKTVFPRAPVKLWSSGDPPGSDRAGDDWRGGFFFVPHHAIATLRLPAITAAINMCSFQEMTTEQVRTYARLLKERGCGALYSLNRDRSSHNRELTSVSDVLGEIFRVVEISLLDAPYTTLGRVRPADKSSAEGVRDPREYRHLIARV